MEIPLRPLVNTDNLGLRQAVEFHTHACNLVIVVAQASTTGLTCVCGHQLLFPIPKHRCGWQQLRLRFLRGRWKLIDISFCICPHQHKQCLSHISGAAWQKTHVMQLLRPQERSGTMVLLHLLPCTLHLLLFMLQLLPLLRHLLPFILPFALHAAPTALGTVLILHLLPFITHLLPSMMHLLLFVMQ